MISETDPQERGGDVVALTDDDLEEEVATLPEHPLGIHDDSELSLAGLQDKLLLVDMGGGRWGRPVRGHPSTHILKVEDRRFPGMAKLEVASLRLAAAAGLTSVDAQFLTVANIPCLIVSRFDRRMIDGEITRLHQEDACQALGLDPERNGGKGKYEAHGGPTLRQVARLLDLYATDAPSEMARLVGAATFTTLIGNADAHGKNLALLHPTPGSVSLAPLYDTVPTVLWSKLPTRAAMTINHKVDLDMVVLDDLVSEAARWPLGSTGARQAAEATIRAVVDALRSDEIPEQLAELVGTRARRMLGA